MIGKALCFVFVMGLSLGLSAQRKNDYYRIRNQLTGVACGVQDSATIQDVLGQLLQVDTTGLKKNLHVYYTDLGMKYYERAIRKSSRTDILAAIACFKSGLSHQPKDLTLTWNLAFQYFLLGECDKMESTLADYELLAAKKGTDLEEDRILMRQNCSMQDRFKD